MPEYLSAIRPINMRLNEFARGAVDIFVNNAGTILRKSLLEHSDEDIDIVLNSNLSGTIRMALGGQ